MRFIACLFFAIVVTNPSIAATVVYNVHGYTMDNGEKVSFVAMEYDNGRVTQLYSTQEQLEASAASRRVDGEGATLLPGLIDAHGHIPGLGHALSAVDLVGSASEAEAAQRTQEFATEFPDEKWVMGRGWNQVLWSLQEFPGRASLDAISAERPIALSRVDGHALWVNGVTLALAGIDDSTPNPDGGSIVRDSKGAATGVLIDNAMDLVFAIVPEASAEQIQAYEMRAMNYLASLGMTSAHDAGITAEELAAYQKLQNAKKMPIRVYPMLHVLDPANDVFLKRGIIIDPEHMLDIRSVKISSDGALGSRGAALFEDYSDKPGHKGLLLLSDEQLDHHISRAMAAGYQVNTHAIGDLANAKVLDYYERLIGKYNSGALRHRIEHSQILRVQDIPRFEASGIIASIQPTHATSDKNMAGDRLGKKRLAGAYVWKSLRDSGAAMAGGSDFPVEPPNPFYGLHAAVTRQSRDNQPLGGWMPEQKLSREESLSLFTEDAAYSAHQEKYIGRLLPGYYADFILVRDDYFKVAEEDIWKNKVLATFVAGEQVYRAVDETR